MISKWHLNDERKDARRVKRRDAEKIQNFCFQLKFNAHKGSRLLDSAEEQIIRHAFDVLGGRTDLMASFLGFTCRTLRNRIRQYGLRDGE